MAFILCGSSKAHHASLDSLALQESRQAFMALKNLPEVNQDVGGMDSFTVCVAKGKKGFGFTVTGGCPVKVGTVKEGSPAEQAGIQKDDVIVKINGKNVSRSIADSVAKIIRHIEHEVVLQLYRPSCTNNTSDQCVPGTPPSQQAPCAMWSPYSPPDELPEMFSQVPSVSEEYNRSDHSFNEEISPSFTYNVEAEVHQESSQILEHYHRTSTPSRSSSRTPSPERYQSQARRAMSFSDLSPEEQSRQEAIVELQKTELAFVKSMQFGNHRYLQKLRYSIISEDQHNVLFQNIEGLVAMADFNTRLFHEKGIGFIEPEYSNYKFVDGVGNVYHRHISLMCDGYEEYCLGAKAAIQMLAELRKDATFQAFLVNPPLKDGEQTLGTFLQRPIQHMKELVVQLQKVFTHTPAQHHDHIPLKRVIQALRHSCSVIYENSQRLCRSTFSLATSSSTLADPVRRNQSPTRSESLCSFQAKSAISHHSGLSRRSCDSRKSHHSQDSGISLRKINESEEHSHHSNHSRTESGYGGSFCNKCNESRRSSNGMSSSQSSEHSRTTVTSVHQASCPRLQSSELMSIHSDPPEVELCSIDSEVLDIQNRLLFGNGIRSFRIASSTRHMIYAGDLLYHDGVQWQQAYVVLLSDLLLISRVESDNYLTVLEEPIVLQDVSSATWNCRLEREFQITVSCSDCGHHNTDEGCRTSFTFRAPSTELKNTWENIVDQRIVACKSQPERDMQFGKVIAEFI